MFKIKEDNTYNDIRFKSLMGWLNDLKENGNYNDACGAKLAIEYIDFLQKKIDMLEEKNIMKDQYLKQIKVKLNELKK